MPSKKVDIYLDSNTRYGGAGIFVVIGGNERYFQRVNNIAGLNRVLESLPNAQVTIHPSDVDEPHDGTYIPSLSLYFKDVLEGSFKHDVDEQAKLLKDELGIAFPVDILWDGLAQSIDEYLKGGK